ncbi:TetR/AcrR family transcriptional regulator [Candidatus Electronema sp. PJ]|uniref:TetR/AcrR family transcriptional regulator n=1 Tax=Candidatus Electronema sp. PJ TaxID=3401572 RepID=UPI003AA8EA71
MAGLREQKKRETKAAIMEAALTLFGERGYENTSIAALARAAGVGKGTIYSYFSSKSEILLAFCEEELTCLHLELQQKVPSDAPLEEKLLLIFMYEFRYVTKNKGFGRTLMREIIFPKELTIEKSQEIESQFIHLFVIMFKEAQEKGQLRCDIELTMTCGHFYALYLMALSAWYSGRLHSEEDVQATLQVMFSQALSGLRPNNALQ